MCVYSKQVLIQTQAWHCGAADAPACLGADVTDSSESCSTTIYWDSVLTRYQECYIQIGQHNLVADMLIMHIISAHACFMVLSYFKKTKFQR